MSSRLIGHDLSDRAIRKVMEWSVERPVIFWTAVALAVVAASVFVPGGCGC